MSVMLTDVEIVEDDVPAAPPPPPLKKRATKRGLSKSMSVPEDGEQDVPTHVTNVYSNCVQRSGLSFTGFPRKPLFSKQNRDDTKSSSGSERPPSPKRKATDTAPVLPETPPNICLINDYSDDDENSVVCTDDADIRSPSSPVPPPPPLLARSRPKRVSRGIQKAFKTLNSVKGELKKSLQSPSTPTVIDVDSPVHNDQRTVRVRHINEVHRFSMAKTDMFYILQVQMASLLGVDTDQIGLYLNDTRISPTETPQSSHLHLADILVCHVLVTEDGNDSDADVSDVDSVRVQLQCRDSRRKTKMNIKKFLPFKVMMEKYARLQGKSVENFQFHFDGEQLNPDMRPGDVDLDNDDTVDVVEKN